MIKVPIVSFVALAALSLFLRLESDVAAEDANPTIVTLGDSYINSYGVAAAETFATRLRSELNAAGHPVTIVEVGFRATSAAGLKWLTESKDGIDLQANPANHVIIVELGQNDCARIDLKHTRANLDNMLTILAEKRIPVLLVGTAAYDICSSALSAEHGADYAEPFAKMFSELAAKHGTLLYADFKEGVTGHPGLLQADNDHPNAAGDAIIVRRMLPLVEALIARVQPR